MSEENQMSSQPKNNNQETVSIETARFAPVMASERYKSVDLLRGFALLGILMINIYCFALPSAALFNPAIVGDLTGINLLVWRFSQQFFFLKFMAIFSMLFGAGLILMTERAEAKNQAFGKTYYRRILWLSVFGLLHAYLLWYGDILFPYAIAGFILYPLRRRSGKTLIIIGLLIFLVGAATQIGAGTFFNFARSEAAAADAAEAAGETVSGQMAGIRQAWTEINTGFNPPPEKIAEEIEKHRGSYWELRKYMVPEVIQMQTMAMLSMLFWRILGLMLIGMGLMKLGVFSARRSLRFYITCAVLGYSIGLPVVYYAGHQLVEHNFDFVYFFKRGNPYDYLASILVSLGHLSMVMIIYKTGVLSWFVKRLTAVGQMALTNYLMHTIICTFIFDGYGLGLFGRFDHFALLGFVVGIWILQLIISPIWLKYYRFGPFEWLWRTLTYLRSQPMKIRPTGS